IDVVDAELDLPIRDVGRQHMTCESARKRVQSGAITALEGLFRCEEVGVALCRCRTRDQPQQRQDRCPRCGRPYRVLKSGQRLVADHDRQNPTKIAKTNATRPCRCRMTSCLML